jgi:hypothetical protein
MFANSARKKSRGEIPGEEPKVRPIQHTGREKLRFLDTEVKRAAEAIADLGQRVERLGTIIADAETNQANLQAAIKEDGGVALANYSAGNCDPESDIAKLVTLAEASSKAANAAKVALPSTEAMLESARSQAVTLQEARNAELNRVLANLADVEGREYKAVFDDLCRRHDRLVGYSQVAQANIGDVRLIVDPLKVPRFALPSMGNADADPFLRHLSDNEFTVAASARTWAKVHERLDSDVDADLSDLI